MKFGLIYDSTDCHMSAQNVRQALPESRCVHFDLSVFKPNAEIEQLLRTSVEQGANVDVILHETGARGLPRGLNRVPIPTACLDIDTFGWTDFRVKWAMLFDYVFTWHPSYVQLFQEAGHPRVFAFPHAVDVGFLGEVPVNRECLYDLGFVGNFGLPQYRQRDRVISKLATRFRTNDFWRKHSVQEMAGVYSRAKVVVNVSRAEFPQEANMRCYEAMAAGALLMTGMPSELTEWGFREGEHFIGWRSEEDIPDLVGHFLQHKEKRLAIARAGQERTLRDFTYQRCIETMIEIIERDGGKLFAPARQWPDEEVHLLYLSYYHRFRLGYAALEEFRLLRRINRKRYWKGLPMVLKALRHELTWTLL